MSKPPIVAIVINKEALINGVPTGSRIIYNEVPFVVDALIMGHENDFDNAIDITDRFRHCRAGKCNLRSTVEKILESKYFRLIVTND